MTNQTLNVQEIKNIIPNRFPILYIDRVNEVIAGQKIVAQKQVTVNEDFMQSQPVMPSTLVVETLAQAGSILILLSEQFQGKTAYIGGINEAKFLHDIVPGDTVMLTFEIIKLKGAVGIANAAALVDGQAMVTCQFTFIVGAQ